MTEKEVLEDNYGGEKLPNVEAAKYTSAHILVYIRESDIDEILSPEDI